MVYGDIPGRDCPELEGRLGGPELFSVMTGLSLTQLSSGCGRYVEHAVKNAVEGIREGGHQ
eukprot:10031374-Prorocentrum_lima.AAC.1